jgi:uncharacterized repeat protein (TIGR04076 family)
MVKFTMTVKEIKGTCDNGHQVGDTFEITDAKTPGGICLSAFSAILPKLMALMLGGDIPWSGDKDADIVACPDPENAVRWEVRRIIS